jgi:hypothetical protein
MSPVALCFSFIFAAAAAVSYFASLACDPHGSCTVWEKFAVAAGVMLLAYLVSRQLEALPRETKPSPQAARTQRQIERRLSAGYRKPVAGDYPSRAGVTRGLLMLPSPRRFRDPSK